MTLGGLAVAQGGLHALAAPAQAWKTPPGYGPLSPVADENTGLPLIMLPDGLPLRLVRLDAAIRWRTACRPPGARRHGGRRRRAQPRRAGPQPRGPRARARRSRRPAHHLRPAARAAARRTSRSTLTAGSWSEAWSSLAGTSTNCAGGADVREELADLRGDSRRARQAARLGLRGARAAAGVAGAAEGHGPLRRTRRSPSTGRPASSTRPRTADVRASTGSCPRTRTASTRAGRCRC